MTVWDPLKSSQAARSIAEQIATEGSAHAWLLAGPIGSGKKTVAFAMAAALNCPVERWTGCGECSSCSRILRNRHPDIHHIVPEGPLIPVDLIREQVIPEAARSPFEGYFKVFIIEEADRMNQPAQNSLLKTLEEPQADTVFILISDRPDEVLETLRSRCRVVRLDPVDEQTIVQVLEQEGAANSDALLAARAGEGNLRRARELAFEEDARSRREMWIEIPRRLTSPMDALDAAAEIVETAREAAKGLESQQRAEIIELAEALGEGRGTAGARNALARRHRRELRRAEELVLAEALTTLGSFYRDVLAVRRGSPEGIANLDALAELRRWSDGGVDDAALVRAVERCVEARAALLKNANVALTVESALVELARLVPVEARATAH
jgi:DNA polymerase III subunit delta'